MIFENEGKSFAPSAAGWLLTYKFISER